jgi:acetyltransferase-like isoleucine patch superfamily enzyme
MQLARRERSLGKLSVPLQFACWLLPASRIKNRLLNWFGHGIAPTASIGPTLALGVKKFHAGENVRIALFNVFRDISNAWLDDYVIIESWNWISAHPIFQTVDPGAGTLYMGIRAKIGSRNYLDCSGTIAVREFGTLGGNRCLLQTHQPDFQHDRQTAGRITVGSHAFVGSGAVMLKGASLPDRSILAANSTMTRASAPKGKRGLYAGSPAMWRQESDGDYFDRATYVMTDHIVDGPMGVLEVDTAGRDQIRIVDGPGNSG